MRAITVVATALLIPSLAFAQQPTTPPTDTTPAPAPVVVPAPVITPPADTATSPTPAVAPAVVPTTVPDSVATIAPGMTVAEVEGAWGKAGVTRTDGAQTFLFYGNDCLKRCGTFDVVILQDGKVVDAIVRASYHRYSGSSSSPAGRKPSFTRPKA
ncbi:MAG TPA: hypothetical protein VFI39_08535 [Gemmatimonadales bacterium]|nr:hypothetical protein [Gemmatimonadales bacterium]